MIKLENISFSFGDRKILKNLNFTFPDKGVFAITGASGEGKTTLLRLLCGLVTPSAGKLVSTHQKAAFAFQEPRLIPWLDCENNINFVLSKEKQGSDIAATLLQELELGEHLKSVPGALSGGMKQRVSLARALAANADLLLLDEPFSALDASLKERIAPHVKAANPSGLTVLVTHDPRDAELLGATVLVLKDGTLTPA